ncbi:MAG: trypsin-like peptidase domain-containing protein [Phycisphaerales bacterium]|nr:trypsin-like peptidase domain-containing protein [Phycisphaerales bacterium]MCI0631600.1 trypsin-like peptidase domain-containing protein [Phycisphaerales bacterium]MCI0676252.1 trypsin-like peptidase domain-containing protein [Phycisphaerales bacterium]
MRKLSGYGPSLIVLGTAALVLVVGPKAVQQLTYEQTRTRVIQARHSLAGNDILNQLNSAYGDIATVVEPSVVHISAHYVERSFPPFGTRDRPGLSTGSGWVYDTDGHIVTNHHVIESATRIDVQLYDGTIRQARIVGSDPSTDVAVIKIAPGQLHPAMLSELDQPINQGDLVFAFGSPFDFRFSMSSGVVSGKDRSVNGLRDGQGRRLAYENFIQVDAAINPGNSGGPLTDYRGRVIGMNTAIATGRSALEEGQFAGIGLAIPLDMIQPAVTQLIKKGYVEKGSLGVTIDLDFDPASAQVLGFIGRGVRLTSVDPSGPAAAAGVRAGDIITRVNGMLISSGEQLRSVVSSMLPGEMAQLTVWRFDSSAGGGTSMVISVPLVRLETLLGQRSPSDESRQSLVELGIWRMASCTPELARHYEVPYHPGVIIELVPTSELSRTLSRGTILVSVRDQPISSVEEFLDCLRQADLRNPVGVQTMAIRPDGERVKVMLRVE